MSKSQRTKGATYEREIAHAFRDALCIPTARNIGQARDGGNDLDIPPLCIEIKRRKTLGTVYGWLQQAINALPAFNIKHKRDDGIPVVVARQDQGESIVILRLTDFLALTRDELIAHNTPAFVGADPFENSFHYAFPASQPGVPFVACGIESGEGDE